MIIVVVKFFFTGTVCKSRWQNIRDQFRKCLIKKGKSHKVTSKIKKYKYEDNLQFVIPYFVENNSICKVDDEQSQSVKSEEEQTESKQNSVRTKKSLAIKRKLSEQELNTPNLTKYTVQRDEDDNPHPIDAFLTGVSATVKNFTPYYQHLAKGRIFEVVQELELQQLPHTPLETDVQSSPNCSDP